MKKAYSRPLFRLIEQQMNLRWPNFRKFKLKSNAGSRAVYRWTVIGGVNVFVEVVVCPKGRDRFFCNFAWSDSSEEFPDGKLENSFPSFDPQSAFDQAECIGRDSLLWNPKSGETWDIPDLISTWRPEEYASDLGRAAEEFKRRLAAVNAMSEEDAESQLIEPLVSAYFEKMSLYVMPYLEQYVAYRMKRTA